MRYKRTLIEEKQITDKLKHIIMISNDEEIMFLTVDYMNGRFIIEKSFQNHYMGLERMKDATDKLDTEEKIVEYLGLEDINE